MRARVIVNMVSLVKILVWLAVLWWFTLVPCPLPAAVYAKRSIIQDTNRPAGSPVPLLYHHKGGWLSNLRFCPHLLWGGDQPTDLLRHADPLPDAQCRARLCQPPYLLLFLILLLFFQHGLSGRQFRRGRLPQFLILLFVGLQGGWLWLITGHPLCVQSFMSDHAHALHARFSALVVAATQGCYCGHRPPSAAGKLRLQHPVRGAAASSRTLTQVPWCLWTNRLPEARAGGAAAGRLLPRRGLLSAGIGEPDPGVYLHVAGDADPTVFTG